jgi:signal transduction histidine kinase
MLSVSDNGKGAGQGFREGGRGMGNIRLRAAEIGATVRFDDTRPGTCVLFRFASSQP